MEGREINPIVEAAYKEAPDRYLRPENPVEMQQLLNLAITAKQIYIEDMPNKYYDALRWYAGVEQVKHIEDYYDMDEMEFSENTRRFLGFAGYIPNSDMKHMGTDDRLRIRLAFWYEHLERYKQASDSEKADVINIPSPPEHASGQHSLDPTGTESS